MMMPVAVAGCFGAQSGSLANLAESPSSHVPRLLLVEDERSIRDLVSGQLGRSDAGERSRELVG
jgi:hypothetical protein